MFFLAISMVGTDFSMIGQLFPHRARIEIKVKYIHHICWLRRVQTLLILFTFSLNHSPIFRYYVFVIFFLYWLKSNVTFLNSNMGTIFLTSESVLKCFTDKDTEIKC
jgi:hypothetical protein